MTRKDPLHFHGKVYISESLIKKTAKNLHNHEQTACLHGISDLPKKDKPKARNPATKRTAGIIQGVSKEHQN